VRKGCAPPSVRAPPRSHTLPLCTHAGAHCDPSPAPFRTPRFGAPTLPFAAPARVARRPARTPSPLHTCGGAPSPFRTPALVRPPFHSRVAPLPGLRPASLACPLRARGGTTVMVRVAPSLVPCVLSPCVQPSPLRAPHPVLLRPRYAHKGGGRAGRAGCVNRGVGHGVVRAEGTGGGCACGAGA